MPPLHNGYKILHWTPDGKDASAKTIQLALAHHRSYAEQAIWQRHMELKLTTCGLTMPTASSSPPLMEKWQCDLCMKVFQSTRALAMHSSRDHGYRKKCTFLHPVTHAKLVDISRDWASIWRKIPNIMMLFKVAGHPCRWPWSRRWTQPIVHWKPSPPRRMVGIQSFPTGPCHFLSTAPSSQQPWSSHHAR